MSDEQETLEPQNQPPAPKPGFFRSKQGQIVMVVILLVVAAGVWGTAYMRMTGAVAHDIPAPPGEPGASGAPATPDAASGPAGKPAPSSSTPVPDGKKDGSAMTQDALSGAGTSDASTTPDAKEMQKDQYFDDTFKYRNPFGAGS